MFLVGPTTSTPLVVQVGSQAEVICCAEICQYWYVRASRHITIAPEEPSLTIRRSSRVIPVTNCTPSGSHWAPTPVGMVMVNTRNVVALTKSETATPREASSRVHMSGAPFCGPKQTTRATSPRKPVRARLYSLRASVHQPRSGVRGSGEPCPPQSSSGPSTAPSVRIQSPQPPRSEGRWTHPYLTTGNSKGETPVAIDARVPCARRPPAKRKA